MLEELLEQKGVRLQRLPITEVWLARLGRLDQQLWALRSQGMCGLGRSIFKDLGLGKRKCGGCDGGTSGGKT